MEVRSQAETSEQFEILLGKLGNRVSEPAASRIPQLLERLPDPLGALQRLEQFYRDPPRGLAANGSESRAIDAALTIFGNSHYLSNILLRRPDLLPWVLDSENLERAAQAGALRAALGVFPADAPDEEVALLLARFKGRHMLRIALRDLLAAAPLAEVARELSTLAEVTIQAAHDHIRQQLVRRFGRPLCDTESGQILCNFTVLAMGKLGGSELNYSSDIDLMYLHTGDGKTSGPVVTTNEDFVKQLAMRLTNLLSTVTAEGFGYRVDLRLRPEGQAGELVVPLTAAAKYYFDRARDWELQMLLKARPVAGDLWLGQQFLDIVTPRIYRTTTDFTQIERLAETRDRMQLQRRARGSGSVDVKLDPGGIRDIEFLVQCLQRLYGGRDRFLRSGGTMYALHRLREKGYLSVADCAALFNAYRFLRQVEHRLQIDENKQTHELPRDAEGLRRLAQQVVPRHGAGSAKALQAALLGHYRAVNEIYERVIRSQVPSASRPVARQPPGEEPADAAGEQAEAPVPSSVWRVHLPTLRGASADLASSFESLSLRWGNRALDHFLERAVQIPEVIGALARQPSSSRCLAEFMEFSPYFAGDLLRFPEDVAVIVSPGDGHLAGPDGEGGELHPAVQAILEAGFKPDKAATALRLFYRHHMLSIQTRSICGGEDVFETLSAASDTAEWILRAAHALSVGEASAEAGTRIEAPDAIRVIALGRLGMREFDLGSDADVVFVIPDSESGRSALWTQAANRIIDIVSSYTADGQMFSIDPRLRPLGNDGELVQTEKQFLTYFLDRSEEWEALTYMKARTVAGHADAGKQFLARLQEILWRRFAQREDLGAMLRRMRSRIESEQGEAKPLKCGAGGYYDIDFLLMYWRLLHAGSFYESLTTPQRIEIIRGTDPGRSGDLDILLRATRVFRSLDHGMRVARGTSSHDLPPTEWRRERLAGLVRRWLPDTDRDAPLDEITSATREAVRDVFRRGFEKVPADS